MFPLPRQIRSIVFDLDGTLYVNPDLGSQIQRTAEWLVAETRGLTLAEGRALLSGARQRLTESLEEEPTLTRTCMELGIETVDFHRVLQGRIKPEKYISNDPVLYALLDSLRDLCDLYIYTNNNLPLTRKILALLGIENLFERVFTIEYSWQPKPHIETLERILAEIGGLPESFLFVGDRHQVDLQDAAGLGIPILQVTETADLLQIHKLLGILP